MRIRFDLEEHEVVEIEAAGALKSLEQPVRRSHDAKIDVLCCPRALEAKLEGDATFERRGVPERDRDPRQEAIKDGELPSARDGHAARGGRLEPVLQPA